jgi:hypothetical protein
VAAIDWTAIDRRIAILMTTARQEQAGMLRYRVGVLAKTMHVRVNRDFLPWYLSFGRRKLEELSAYNLYAHDRVVAWMTGERQQSAQIALISTFESEFSRQVIRPDELRHEMQQIGQDLATAYANRIAVGLRAIQDESDISFMDWQTHLAEMPRLSFTDANGHRTYLSMEALAAPHPIWLDLGNEIANNAGARLSRLPSIIDLTTLVDAKGQSIFSVGENAGLYFGSYLVYWLALIILLRSGLVPFSLFGVLLGWLLWETFAWGSWIGFEYLDFEQTRANLAPVIDARASAWLDQFQAMIADGGPSGPLKVLYQFQPPGPG